MFKNLVKKLYPFSYSVTGSGNDSALRVFQSELPFRVHEFNSGRELNGWTIPLSWQVIKATIYREGRRIYDGKSSPLGVPVLSPSFVGTVNLTTLMDHLYYSDEHPDAIVYHWAALYRPLERTWGFCVPKNIVLSLEEGLYDIELLTQESPGTMKVLDYFLPGMSPETVLLNAHNCHPYQANDDISGCAVAIRVMQALASRAYRRFSYRLVIAPELIGTAFWLDSIGVAAQNLKYSIMLKSIGNKAPLRLQESFTGESRIDHAAKYAFKSRYGEYESGKFRTIYGNDETVFEAPGYEIPSISLTRFPFKEYHTNLDTPEALDEKSLQDTYEATISILNALEQDLTPKFLMKGLVSLSHPRYNLYRAAVAPGIDRQEYSAINAKWNLLMNCLPRELNGKNSLLDIATRYELPLDDVSDYVKQWINKGLVSAG
jgi:aminopeptidase-like protein